MKAIQGFKAAGLAAVFALSNQAFAKYEGAYGGVSANYTQQITNIDTAGNLFMIELDGGADFSWGDFYGVIDYSNPFYSQPTETDPVAQSKNQRFFGKVVARINLGAGFNVYNHANFGYDSATGKDGDTNNYENYVNGLGYEFSNSTVTVAPFIGMQMSRATDKDFGINGGMFGLSAAYNFNLGPAKMTLDTWNEMTFAHTERFNTESVAHDGNVGINWHVTDHISLGAYYDYGYNKANASGFQQDVMVRLKFSL